MEFTMYSGFSGKIAEEGVESAVKYVVDMGFSSVEILENIMSEQDLIIPDLETAKKTREMLEQQGLRVACYSAFACLWDNDFTEDALKRSLDIAAELGSPYFHHTLLPWLEAKEGLDADTAISAVVEKAVGVANYAEKLGITCLYEEQGKYVNGVKGFGKFYSEVKKRCNNVGVCGDFGNIYFVNEHTEAFFKEYAREIKHVHIKDYLHKECKDSPGKYWMCAEHGNWLRETMVGSGIVDFEKCIKILQEAGYNGAYALELTHPEPFDEGVKQAMEYLQKIVECNCDRRKAC